MTPASVFAQVPGMAVGMHGTSYDLYQSIAPDAWWRQSIVETEKTGSRIHSMGTSIVGTPTLTEDEDDPEFKYSGKQWSTTSNPLTYGGTYVKSSLRGATMQWSTPKATKVGLRGFRTTNGGYAKVTVDGSATAANMLPTAEEEVAAGRLAAPALVPNGGTLNPDDRLFNSYAVSSDPDSLVLFAKILDSEVHTVALTVTGYSQQGSTDSRVYVSGGIYAAADVEITTPHMDLAPLVTILAGSSVSEYAIIYQADEAAIPEFVGNRHGNEVEYDLELLIDGRRANLADGQVVTAKSAEVIRRARVLNPANLNESVANSVCSWTMTHDGGLNLQWSIDWIRPGITGTAYIAMLPTEANTFSRGQVIGAPAVDLLADDDSVNGSFTSGQITLWQPEGHATVSALVNNLQEAVNSWATSDDHAWLQDRAGGEFNKGYFQRTQNTQTEAVDVGTQWRTDATYRVFWTEDLLADGSSALRTPTWPILSFVIPKISLR